MLSFEHIEFLWGLLLLPLFFLIYLLARRRKAVMRKRLGDPELVKEMMGDVNQGAFLKKFLLVFFALGLLVTAVANLRTPIGSSKITRNGSEVMIALDVSKSMLAQDVKPDRLTRAKQFLSRLVDKLPDDQIGIVVFAGRAYLQMPLSGDHAATKMYISASSPKSIPTQGTVLADALSMSSVSFASKEKKYKTIVLISDGEDHDENALKTAKDLADQGVVIHTIGIGSSAGAPIPDEASGGVKIDQQGNTVISKLNEDELASIAQAGNGTYQLCNNAERAAANVAAAVNSMDKKNITDDSLLNFRSFFQYIIGLALLLLLIEMFVSEIKKPKKVKMKSAVAILFVLFSLQASAQNDKAVIKEGNQQFDSREYEQAANSYQKALELNKDNVTAEYNLGNALYKWGKKDEAIASYDNVLKTEKTTEGLSNTYYNKAVVLQNNDKLEECIAAYKQALRLTPGDADARHNLQQALKKKKEQQQQQKDKNQDQDKDNKNDGGDKDKPKPKPQPSKLSQREAEDKLKALMQQEKNLQDKLHKTNAQSPETPEKDW